MPNKCIGQRIKEIRELNKYTREELAEAAEISAKYLYQIEAGMKNFSSDVLGRLAQSLSVSCDYIMFGEAEGEHREEKIVTIIEQMNTKQVIAAQRLFLLMAEMCDVL